MAVDNRFKSPAGGRVNTLDLKRTEWQIDDVAVNTSAAELNSLVGTTGNTLGTDSSGKKLVSNSHTVTSGEGSAHTVTIATGLTTVLNVIVQIIRSGKVITGDASISFTAGNLVVADGSTYALTAADIIHYLAYGS